MILTDYYRFEKLSGQKSKMRMDCTASTNSYDEFECRRAIRATKASIKRDATNVGDLVIYYGDRPEKYGGNMQRKADKSISIKGKNLSSIFVPDIRKSFAYGDFGGTNDALLFVFHNLSTPNGVIEAGGVIEIFIARGQSNNQKQLYNLLADGELDEEMNKLRNQVAKSATYTQNRENTLY